MGINIFLLCHTFYLNIIMSKIKKVAGLGIGSLGYSICAGDQFGLAAFTFGIPSLLVGTALTFGGFAADAKEQRSEKEKNDNMRKQITELNQQLTDMHKQIGEMHKNSVSKKEELK
jgi:hypothetical protein